MFTTIYQAAIAPTAMFSIFGSKQKNSTSKKHTHIAEENTIIQTEIKSTTRNGVDEKTIGSERMNQENKNSEARKELKRRLVFEYETDTSSSMASQSAEQPVRSLSRSLRKRKRKIKQGLFSDKRTLFNFVAFVIPCTISMWYAAAILFPPETRAKYDLLLWDDGQLIIEDDGQLTLCPRPSICSEGLMQLMAITMARLSAFASYVFMGATFLTKMHFLNRFLASTYLRKFIPFECLHHIHKKSARMFGGLIFMHTLSHYMRYMARSDVDQLTTKVHVSGLDQYFKTT